MRCYHFCNFYLSQIQHGIQSAHCQMTMFTKYYDHSTVPHDMLYDWATNHKTMICLNGGYSDTLDEIYHTFLDFQINGMEYPFARFQEESCTLKYSTTNVAIVLPEEVYNCELSDDKLTESIAMTDCIDHKIVKMLRGYRLI